MLEQHLSPIAISTACKPYQIGANIRKYETQFPTLAGAKAALILVCTPEETETSLVREHLYSLVSTSKLDRELVDLGNIITQTEPAATNFVITAVCKELIGKDIVPLIITSHPDQGEAAYQALEILEKDVDVAYISSHLPLLEYELLNRICTSEPNYLKNLSTLGFQSHYIPPKAMDILENLKFEHQRLGLLKTNIEDAEIYLRNTAITLLHLDAVKHADAPAKEKVIPNGLTGEEVCQLARYSGSSDFMKVFALLGYSSTKDQNGQTASLIAQILWYVLDGLQHRANDYPSAHNEFINYRCDIAKDDAPLLFIKSKLTARWWMKIEHPGYPEDEDKKLIIPCTYTDYLEAANEETPERYLNALKKLV